MIKLHSRLALIALACLTLGACGKGEATAPQGGGPVGPDGIIALSPTQIAALRFAKAEVWHFPVETEATGAVSFAHDPAVAQAFATYLTALATRDQTAKEYKRVHALGAASGIAAKEIEQAASDMRTAEANLAAAQAALRALGASPHRLEQLAQTQSAAGEKVVLVNAVEDDVPAIHTNAKASVTLDAYPGKIFEGRVEDIYGAIDPNTHRAAVRIIVMDRDNRLRPGMLADARIAIAPPFDALSVPQTAVVREGDGTLTAWVTADRHHFAQRTLRTGLSEDGRIQIVQGLHRGETVVTDGAIFLDNMLQSPPGD